VQLFNVRIFSAGQECPTTSGALLCLVIHAEVRVVTLALTGIPMGLGAGFKLIDKDKDREKDKERDKEKDREDVPHSPHDMPSGWTSMIEDWLCNGTGAVVRTFSPTVADVSSPKALSPRPLSLKEPRKGPYTLLAKERMMGIYLAVYIHRDLSPLVRGVYSPCGVIVEALVLIPCFRDFEICCYSWSDRGKGREQGGCWDHC